MALRLVAAPVLLAALILADRAVAAEPPPPAADPLPPVAQPWPPPAAARPVSPAPPPRGGFRTELGAATLVFNGSGGDVRQDGVAIAFRSRTPVQGAPRVAANVNVTLGLTDWDRAKEWIDAGNDAGSWTTDKFGQVANWVEEGGDSQPIRLMGAFFADIFLGLTYVAVPVCYMGSPFGAVSHLQMDVTASYDFGGGAFNLWVEGGAGVMGLPVQFIRWEYAAGPVAGVGLDAGPFSFVGRLLWAPDALTSSSRADESIVAGSLTAGIRF